uniref:Uncharacterized protein n=1 Tax=Cacopsylla melanoneura TaxID=428564 RepID=A0A8D8TEM2_9HEMI
MSMLVSLGEYFTAQTVTHNEPFKCEWSLHNIRFKWCSFPWKCLGRREFSNAQRDVNTTFALPLKLVSHVFPPIALKVNTFGNVLVSGKWQGAPSKQVMKMAFLSGKIMKRKRNFQPTCHRFNPRVSICQFNSTGTQLVQIMRQRLF